MIFFENLSIFNFLLLFVKHKELLSNRKNIVLNYIDSSFLFEKLLVPILQLLKIEALKVNFKLIDVRDNKGELIRFRIVNSDLFDFQKKMVNSEAYMKIYDQSWSQNNILNYLNKGLIGMGIPDKSSVSRVLFILGVVNWYSKNKLDKSPIVFLDKRPWFDVYKSIAQKHNITIIGVNNSFIKATIDRIRYFIVCHRKLYYFVLRFRRRCWNSIAKIESDLRSRVYIEGRGDINFSNDGNNSDFFVCFDSKLSYDDIVYSHLHKDEEKYLQKYGVSTPSFCEKIVKKYKRNYTKPKLNYSAKFSQEYRAIKTILSLYDYDRTSWHSFFRKNNIKVFFSWFKYGNSHMAITDAIHDNGGVSVIWQLAFDGLKFHGCTTNADVVFNYSKFSSNLERRLGSDIKYNIINGYPKDYLFEVAKEKASKIRKRLMESGVKKIVFVVDEHSTNDNRWHTGHELQRENYSYILKEVLRTPWLGVIFKPKVAADLRGRLGVEVSTLLSKAEKQGRCFIYQESNRYTTAASPALAALSADVCIHGHLSAGTVALESVLGGIPTLLIDRERCPDSKFYEIGGNNVIFSNWPDAITTVMQYFSAPESVSGLGDWSSIIDELDPYRDGLASKRMGTYLHWLVEGFNGGMKSNDIMKDAANKYKKLWGEDKVICRV